MKSLAILLIGVVIGAAATWFVVPGALVGAGAGAGIATGLQAGLCLTAEAAKEKGYVTADQVGELLAAAGEQISAKNVSASVDISGGDAKCQEFIAKLREAAKN